MTSGACPRSVSVLISVFLPTTELLSPVTRIWSLSYYMCPKLWRSHRVQLADIICKAFCFLSAQYHFGTLQSQSWYRYALLVTRLLFGCCHPDTRRRGMSLTKVQLSWEALLACTAHALSTEQQEIMGILIGSWQSGTPEQVRVTTLSDYFSSAGRWPIARDSSGGYLLSYTTC